PHAEPFQVVTDKMGGKERTKRYQSWTGRSCGNSLLFSALPSAAARTRPIGTPRLEPNRVQTRHDSKPTGVSTQGRAAESLALRLDAPEHHKVGRVPRLRLERRRPASADGLQTNLERVPFQRVDPLLDERSARVEFDGGVEGRGLFRRVELVLRGRDRPLVFLERNRHHVGGEDDMPADET